MKQIKKKIKYLKFNEEYEPTEEYKKKRAWNYTFVATAINDVGAGADKNLEDIKQIIAMIRSICLSETGYEIEGYNTELVGSGYRGYKRNPYQKVKAPKE